MWKESHYQTGGSPRFFRISLRDENLRSYYITNFALMQHHGYSLTELEQMIPWERAMYIALVAKHVKEENERLKLERQTAKSNKR